MPGTRTPRWHTGVRPCALAYQNHKSQMKSSYGTAKRARPSIESVAVVPFGSYRSLSKRKRGLKHKKLFKQAGTSLGCNLMMIPRNPSCFPEVLHTDLFFTERFSVSLTAGVGTNYIYRGNSLFDPNLTGIGGQPKWFDQIKAVYGKYEVLNSVAEVTMCHPATGTNVYEVAMGAFAPLSPPGSFDEIINAENSSTAVMTQQAPTIRLVSYGDTAKLTGLARGDDQVQAVSTANPAVVWWYYVSAYSPTTASGTSLYGIARIRYTCKFSMQTETLS